MILTPVMNTTACPLTGGQRWLSDNFSQLIPTPRGGSCGAERLITGTNVFIDFHDSYFLIQQLPSSTSWFLNLIKSIFTWHNLHPSWNIIIIRQTDQSPSLEWLSSGLASIHTGLHQRIIFLPLWRLVTNPWHPYQLCHADPHKILYLN